MLRIRHAVVRRIPDEPARRIDRSSADGVSRPSTSADGRTQPSSLMKMFLNCTRLGGPVHWPSFRLPPWCCSASGPRAGRSGIVAPGITSLPLRTVDRLALDGDLEVVPLADRACRPASAGVTAARSSGGVFGSVRMPYISPEPIGQHQMLTWWLPDAAEVDAGIGVGQGQLQLLAVDVPGVGAVGQDVGDVRVDVRRFLEPPVDVQLEVAELAVQPEALVPLGLALGVVVDHAVDHLPVAAIALGHLPAGEVLAVEERREARRRLVVGGRRRRGQAHDQRHGEAEPPTSVEIETSGRTGTTHGNQPLGAGSVSHGPQAHRSATRGAEQGTARIWIGRASDATGHQL